MIEARTHGALLAGLARAAADRPVADKLLICRPRGVGRELLHSLATAGCDWLGFRVQTPWELAAELASASLARDGLAIIDRFDEIALTDEAIDQVLETAAGKVLAELGDAVGFRAALAGSVRELRLAGLDSADVAGVYLEDLDKRNALAAIQRAYEAALHAGALVDRADVLKRAADELAAHRALPTPHIYLMPGMHLRGLRGRLLALLGELGAEVLPADPVLGLPRPAALLAAHDDEPASGRLSYLYAVQDAPGPDAPVDLFTPAIEGPDLELFAAASPIDELREVLRRVMAAGVPFDDVEIIATDPVVYGTALDSIAPGLVAGEPTAPDGRSAGNRGSRVTHAAGLPIARTRTGRAVVAYLRWIQEDFPEEIVRSLLNGGVLRPPARGAGHIGGTRLGRALRELRIGWGRDRYLRQIDWRLDAFEKDPSQRDRRGLSAAKLDSIKQHRRDELEALRALFEPLLEATPPTPDRLGAHRVRVSVAGIAQGVLRFLDFVPTAPAPDTEAEAKRRLEEVLRRATATLLRESEFRGSVAVLERLIDLRVPSPSTHGRVPWSSAGGYLHFADLEHGGLTGRPHTFVIGLDAGRFPGPGRQDPVLLDRERARLEPDGLLRSADALREARYSLATLLGRLRGRVTLSYSAWDAREGRNLSPSPALLQAQRLRSADPSADYRALHAATRPIAGPVPSDTGLLDAADVWLDSLNDNGVLRHGVDAVIAGFAGLKRGVEARQGRLDGRLNAYKGAIAARPAEFDPRRRGGDLLLSASRLQTLATCPLQYFFRHVLHLRVPEDIEFTPDAWLDAKQRGSLLHNVYERALTQARDAGVEADDPQLARITETVFDDELGRMQALVPVPSQAIFEREGKALRTDLGVFLEMLAEDRTRWLETEWEFGFRQDGHPAAELALEGGTVLLRGAVDRIDELEGDQLGIVDYKTGSTYQYGDDTGVYHGGRRLQHALYTHAVEQILGRRVTRASYHFPTRKGEGLRLPFERRQLDLWPQILDRLFDMIGAGLFPPAFDREAPCKFCDFKPICRATEDRYGKIQSPPVRWAQSNHTLLPEYDALKLVRKIDE